jgi:hypothetical protein
LYGTFHAALQFWRKLTGVLKGWGFVINPYDWCVANKTVDGKQCTIVWHVVNLKISRQDTDIVSHRISLLEAEFGKAAPLSVTCGKVHDYLGCGWITGKVNITMVPYIEGMIDKMPEDMRGMSSTPAGNHLFMANQDATKLSDEDSIMFHHLSAKLLFLCKRARPDLQTAVAFLTTRVKSPDINDYKKLARVMKYLLTLEVADSHIVQWWIDASFGVHPDMKSHTGGVMSLGKGGAYGTSTRQKLVTKSFTEAELVGVSDVLPQVIWTRNFLIAQGYKVRDSGMYQDNKSAILLEENRRG